MQVDQILQFFVFAVLTIITLGGAIGVVTSRNLFHSALFLVLSLTGVVGYYILLDAGFLAVVQLMVYIGAISILIIFAIMLSRGMMASKQRQRNDQWWMAGLIGFLLFVVPVVVVWQVAWPIADTQALASPNVAISQLGEALVGPYVIPFEVVSVLLLAALLGAIILARDTTE